MSTPELVERQLEVAGLNGELETVMQGIVERLLELTGGDGASLALPHGDMLRIEVAIGTEGPLLGRELPIAASVAGACYRSCKSQLMSDMATDPRANHSIVALSHAASLVAVPLVVDGAPRGVLIAQSTRTGAFGASTVRTAELLAQSAAIAIRNAELVRELERKQRTLHEVVETQREISELAIDLDATMKAVVDRCQRLVGADAAGIEWVDGTELVLASVSGAFARHEGLRMRIDHSLSGAALATGELQVCEDAASDPRIDPDTCGATGVRSFILAPLYRHGRIAGNLCIASTRPNAFDGLAVETVELMSAFVSAAIRNADELAARQELVEALRESEERFRGAFDYAAIASALMSLDGVILDVNERACEVIGYSKDELVGLSTAAITHPDDVAADKEIFERFRTGALDRHTVEKRNVRRDGRVASVRRNLALVRDGDGKPLYIVAQILDLTLRKESQELFLAVWRRSPVAKLIVDDDRRLVDVNPGACELLGYTHDELLGLRVDDIVPSDAAIAELWQTFVEEGSLSGAFKLRRRDGSTRDVEYSASTDVLPGRHLAILTDVTEQLELEQQLRQSQKMEAIGRLAGGVAHDFNNLLTAIGGYSDFLLRDLGDDPIAQSAVEIKKAADRAASLTRQLLAFSRRQVLQPRVLDVNAVVAEMQMMLRRLIGEDVDLVTVLEPQLSAVRADPSQLEQVIVNLVVNARDAMHDGGSLTIETANVDDAEHGRRVALTITDTGVGMTDEERQKLFEPFFTTKAGGTGLGLATVHGIVEQSGGTIEVESRLGLGSRFTILLPATEWETAAEPPVPAGGPAEGARGNREVPPAKRERRETILLVEDEAIVRRLVAEMLENAGYHVLEAADGNSAVELVRRHTAPIDLLVTDVVMPGMSGRDVATAITSLRPGLTVLFMSGYTDSAIVHHGVLDPDTAFLQKPFSAAQLTAKVASLLAA
jgi:PAS domain S-box-containing protein